ncbi:MAG: 16S rRNA (guanine(966)-N(2))-methyltransferase RsmD [Bifidobacteriaceae bacterium]|jgi:16S rRNA (guanine966-N2)-methyltransferase|nr:16S rRNA (guanine(966)-N(2))-methyltransferase RsmD [Bifidobacteriaceae bacterium]
MVRIVAGSAGGRSLKVPPGLTRPTSDRVREALFSLLQARFGGSPGWATLRVLDLYAGSGALALEALSRGAAAAAAVESGAQAVRAIRANAAALGVSGKLAVVSGRVEKLLGRPPPRGLPAPFGLVFADPPYDLPPPALDAMLTSLAQGSNLTGAGPRWLADGALVVVERSARTAAPSWPATWEDIGVRKYGETVLHLAEAPRAREGAPRPRPTAAGGCRAASAGGAAFLAGAEPTQGVPDPNGGPEPNAASEPSETEIS